MILRLTADGKMKVVAGRPLQCPPTAHLDTDLEFATQATLVMPQSITFAANGDLYIGESDSQRINRVRIVGTYVVSFSRIGKDSGLGIKKDVYINIQYIQYRCILSWLSYRLPKNLPKVRR